MSGIQCYFLDTGKGRAKQDQRGRTAVISSYSFSDARYSLSLGNIHSTHSEGLCPDRLESSAPFLTFQLHCLGCLNLMAACAPPRGPAKQLNGNESVNRNRQYIGAAHSIETTSNILTVEGFYEGTSSQRRQHTNKCRKRKERPDRGSNPGLPNFRRCVAATLPSGISNSNIIYAVRTYILHVSMIHQSL